MSRFTVQNESGQVISYDLIPGEPRQRILEQRIARGELTKVTDSTESRAASVVQVVVVEDEHTGLRDEKGDLLKSVHGGGLDPDADGDEAGQPSGSKAADDVDGDVAGQTAFRGRPTAESLYAAASKQDDEKVDEPEPAEETGTTVNEDKPAARKPAARKPAARKA